MIHFKDIFTLPQTYRLGRSKLSISDKLIVKTILPFIPNWVKPNHVTVFRFFLIPFVVYFLYVGNLAVGFWVFGISILTDAIDGAMARFRHQITAWGKFYDPMADKLLIVTAGLIIVWRYLHPIFAVLIILFEFLIIGIYWFKTLGTNQIPQAKWAGKIKMILQSLALLFIILAVLVEWPFLLVVSAWMLGISFLFAFISLFIYNSI